MSISGLSFVLRPTAPNFGSMFIVLDPFEKRQSPDLRDTAIMARLRKALGERSEGRAGHRVWGVAGPRARRRRRIQADGGRSRRAGAC